MKRKARDVKFSNQHHGSSSQGRLFNTRQKSLFRKNLNNGKIQLNKDITTTIETGNSKSSAARDADKTISAEACDLLIDRSGLVDSLNGTPHDKTVSNFEPSNDTFSGLHSPTIATMPKSFQSNLVMVQNESAEFVQVANGLSQRQAQSKIGSKWGLSSNQNNAMATTATNRTLLQSQRGDKSINRAGIPMTSTNLTNTIQGSKVSHQNVLSTGTITPNQDREFDLRTKSMLTSRMQSGSKTVTSRPVSTRNLKQHVTSHRDKVDVDSVALKAQLEQVQTVIGDRARAKSASQNQALLPRR